MQTPPASIPPKDSAFWESPALKGQSDHYPPRFNGKVPVVILMTQTVRPDMPFFAPWGTVLCFGEYYYCWTNINGAVAGICENGFKLGVKPDEFEVVAWFDPNAQIYT